MVKKTLINARISTDELMKLKEEVRILNAELEKGENPTHMSFSNHLNNILVARRKRIDEAEKMVKAVGVV